MAGPTAVTQAPTPTPAPTATPAASSASTSRVDQAVDRIQDLTRDDGFLGTGRNGHMHEVQDILSGQTGLSPSEVQQVVSQLSPDDLSALADDINAGGIFGHQGLSADEKKDLFNSLAQSLDGAQLAKVSAAFGARDDVIALGDSVGRFATNDTKVGYVQAMAGRTTDQLSGDVHISGNGSHIQFSDPDALAVGEAIAGLKGDPANVDRAINSLSDDQLRAVIQSGAERESRNTVIAAGPVVSSSVSGSYKADNLVGVLDAVATSNDAAVKARVFAQGGRVLGEVAGSNSLLAPNVTAGDEAAKIRQSLQGILDSDVTGVVGQLETNDRYGAALTNYVKETLKLGEAGEKAIGENIARLQRGNDLQGNALDRINTQTNDYYPNAQSLGYFAGATQAAVSKIAADQKAQAELVGSIFKSAVGLATKGLDPVSSAAVGLYTDQVVKDAVSAFSGGGSNLRDTFYQLAFPRDPATRQPYEGPAERDYDSALNRVLAANP